MRGYTNLNKSLGMHRNDIYLQANNMENGALIYVYYTHSIFPLYST